MRRVELAESRLVVSHVSIDGQWAGTHVDLGYRLRRCTLDEVIARVWQGFCEVRSSLPFLSANKTGFSHGCTRVSAHRRLALGAGVSRIVSAVTRRRDFVAHRVTRFARRPSSTSPSRRTANTRPRVDLIRLKPWECRRASESCVVPGVGPAALDGQFTRDMTYAPLQT